MSSTSKFTALVPDPLNSFEGGERFSHRDLATGWDRARLAAEAHVIEHRLAQLAFRNDRGRFLACMDGELVYEQEWLRERLQRLRSILARRAA
jgi:hypothetical protein